MIMLMKKPRASDLLESLTCDPDCEKIVITSRFVNGNNGDLDDNVDEKTKILRCFETFSSSARDNFHIHDSGDHAYDCSKYCYQMIIPKSLADLMIVTQIITKKKLQQ